MAAALLIFMSCGTQNKSGSNVRQEENIVRLELIGYAPVNRYQGLDYGIRFNLLDKRAFQSVLKKHDECIINNPIVQVYPNIRQFVDKSMREYMKAMGFSLNSDISTDYLLSVSINEFHVSWLSGIGWSGTVSLNLEIHEASDRVVYPATTVIGKAHTLGSGNDYQLASETMNKAYLEALEGIDWDRIAYFLNKSASSSLEKNKQVTGMGNTALENTVIRWYIDSSPKGADVHWRVVSSTPEVKNTNLNFVGSTPFESTEVFDIKGLSHNNSGNVQIEITCEKGGYVTQKKRFNLRQVIEQKEISTKFNLVTEN